MGRKVYGGEVVFQDSIQKALFSFGGDDSGAPICLLFMKSSSENTISSSYHPSPTQIPLEFLRNSYSLRNGKEGVWGGARFSKLDPKSAVFPRWGCDSGVPTCPLHTNSSSENTISSFDHPSPTQIPLEILTDSYPLRSRKGGGRFFRPGSFLKTPSKKCCFPSVGM